MKKIGSKLFIVFGLVAILVCCLVSTTAFAFADYEDLSSNAIVNFNQLITDTYNHNYSYTYVSGSTRITMTNAIGDSGTNYYYIHIVKTTTNQLALYAQDTSGSIAVFAYTSDTDYSAVTSKTDLNYFSIAHGADTEYTSITLINLTTMFGSGYEPTVDECAEIFTAEYYAYNTGTAMSLNGVDAYQEGVQSVYDSMTYELTASNVYLTASAYSGTLDKQTLSVQDQTCIAIGCLEASGILAIPLGAVIPAGTCIYFYCGMLGFASSEDYVSDTTGYFCVAQNYNNTMYPLYIDTTDSFVDQEDYEVAGGYPSYIKFNLAYDTDTLYISESTTQYYITTPSWDSDGFYLFNTAIVIPNVDIASLVKNSYDKGYDKASTYYSTGNAGYNAIYNAGYSAGLEADTPYTFGYLMSSVIEAPLNAVLSIFNFDFLGVNFKNMITLILTLMIIISIVRLFMGGE